MGNKRTKVRIRCNILKTGRARLWCDVLNKGSRPNQIPLPFCLSLPLSLWLHLMHLSMWIPSEACEGDLGNSVIQEFSESPGRFQQDFVWKALDFDIINDVKTMKCLKYPPPWWSQWWDWGDRVRGGCGERVLILNSDSPDSEWGFPLTGALSFCTCKNPKIYFKRQ